jgi:hypothetical protein
MTRRDCQTALEQARQALDFGDHVPVDATKQTAYLRAIAHALVVLAATALDGSES